MFLSKDLEGATVERVYWAVPSSSWLPVIGQQFESYADADAHVGRLFAEKEVLSADIISRMVFRKVNGVTEDVEVARDHRVR